MLDKNLKDDGVYSLGDAFAHPAHVSHWKRSKSENLFRHYRGITITISPDKKRAGFFVLCIAGPVSWGRKFWNLGAANPECALREAIRKTECQIENDKMLRKHVLDFEKKNPVVEEMF